MQTLPLTRSAAVSCWLVRTASCVFGAWVLRVLRVLVQSLRRLFEVSGLTGCFAYPAGHHVDKISQIAFHPTAKDLLVAATNDLGKASLRFFDLEAGTEAKQVTLDIQGVS